MVGTIVAIVGAVGGMLTALAPIVVAIINKDKPEKKPTPVKEDKYLAFLEEQVEELQHENSHLENENRRLSINSELCKEIHGGFGESRSENKA